jgi:hypothetical protein
MAQRRYSRRYLNIQRLNYLWTIRHSSARIAGNLITERVVVTGAAWAAGRGGEPTARGWLPPVRSS